MQVSTIEWAVVAMIAVLASGSLIAAKRAARRRFSAPACLAPGRLGLVVLVGDSADPIVASLRERDQAAARLLALDIQVVLLSATLEPAIRPAPGWKCVVDANLFAAFDRGETPFAYLFSATGHMVAALAVDSMSGLVEFAERNMAP
jgi:hypothetical protein